MIVASDLIPSHPIPSHLIASHCIAFQIKDARPLIEDMEIEKRLDMTTVTRDAIRAVEETGIVFIDEIDKVRPPFTLSFLRIVGASRYVESV